MAAPWIRLNWSGKVEEQYMALFSIPAETVATRIVTLEATPVEMESDMVVV
jgi:hypothetical protein